MSSNGSSSSDAYQSLAGSASSSSSSSSSSPSLVKRVVTGFSSFGFGMSNLFKSERTKELERRVAERQLNSSCKQQEKDLTRKYDVMLRDLSKEVVDLDARIKALSATSLYSLNEDSVDCMHEMDHLRTLKHTKVQQMQTVREAKEMTAKQALQQFQDEVHMSILNQQIQINQKMAAMEEKFNPDYVNQLVDEMRLQREQRSIMSSLLKDSVKKLVARNGVLSDVEKQKEAYSKQMAQSILNEVRAWPKPQSMHLMRASQKAKTAPTHS